MKVTTSQALAASLVHHNAATNSRLQMLAGVVVATVSASQTQYNKDGSETTPTLEVVYDTIKARGNKVFSGENRTAWDNYAPKAFSFARKVLDNMPLHACVARAIDADSVTDAINAIVALFTALDITKRMEAAFETFGYTHNTLAGARLPHRDDDQMMPYIDYCPLGIIDDDGYIVMQSKVSYDSHWLYLQGTNGTFIDTQLCEYSQKWNFGEHFFVHTRNGVQSWSSNSRYDYAREIVNRNGNYEIWANTDLDRNGFPIQQEEAA